MITIPTSSSSNTKKKKKKMEVTEAGPTNKKREQKKRNASVRIQLRNGRIYGSENGKTCHQCRQKTLDFSLSCKNLTGSTECTLHFCYKCLLNRYGEIAEEIAGTVCQWKCPRCRGVCNCSLCMKKRGVEPTGILIPIAKSKGFSSVSEMLQLEKFENPKEDEIYSNKKKHSHEDISVDIKMGIRENTPNEKHDSKNQTKTDVKKAKNNKKSLAIKAGDNVNKGRKSKAAARSINFEISGDFKMSKFPTDTENFRSAVKNEIVEEIILDQENEVKKKIKVSDTQIPLPQGTELTKVANFNFSTEDVGHALQFLEFCEAFAQVLGLKRGEPELLLEEMLSYQDSNSRYSVKTLCIKLLSIIQNDAKEGCSSEESIERNPLLEALSNPKCVQLQSESNEHCSELKLDEYIKLNSSRKLRILNFLCDEALSTQELRNWIEVKTLELDEQNKEAVKMFQNLEKKHREKVRDKMAKAIVLRTGAPISISEHKNLVSLIKMEASKSLASMNRKMKESDAVRSDPIVTDACGSKFWKLRGYNSEMNILRQDVSHGDLNFFEEKWFNYHIDQKANIEAYMSSFKKN